MKILVLILFLLTNCAKNNNILKNIYKNINEKLILAIEEGKYLEVSFLIRDGADVNYINKDNQSALEIAINRKELEILNLLLKNEIKISKEKNIKRIYEIALNNLHFGIIDEMLKKGYMLKEGAIDDNKYFLFLCYASNLEEIEKFVKDKKVEPNLSKESLNFAIRGGNFKITEFLIKNYEFDVNFKDNSNNENTLLLACKKGYIEIVKLLLGHNYNINIDKLLHKASQEGNIKLIKLLLSKGADINSKVKRTGFGNFENEYEGTPLMEAIINRHVEVAKLLIEKGANVNEESNTKLTSLMLASRNGYTEVVNLLLNTGADVNYKNENGQTALEIALKEYNTYLRDYISNKGDDNFRASILPSIERYESIAKLLIQKGANVDNKNSNGFTLLMSASKKGEVKVVKFLLDAEANINHKANNGLTSLAIASANNNLEVVDLLIKNLCDINIKTNNGFTSLMFAVHEGNVKIVDLLIKNGADINIRDKCGYSALVYALGKNNREIAKILLENFCEVDEKINLNNILEELIIEKIKNKDIENASLLIVNYNDKINFNFKDSQENSFLHYAAMVGDYKLFNLLFKDKLNINSINRNGETPLYCALSKEKIDENFICYLINKGAILGPQSFINQKPIIEILSPFVGICKKLVYEPLVKKFLSTSSTFTFNVNSFKIGMKDKFKELVKAIKLNQEDFINETSMTYFLRDILIEIPVKINLNEVDIKGDVDLNLNYFDLILFDEIFDNSKKEDYHESILAKGLEESKRVFKEKLAKIINTKPAVIDSNFSKNDENFKEFITKKRLYKLIMLIKVLRGTSNNDQKIKIILNELLDNLVFRNDLLESINAALKSLSGKEIDIKEIIDENLMNLRYEILKEVVIEEINKNNVSVEIDGELYETALTPYLLSNLTLNIGNIIKVRSIYDRYNVKYKYNKEYIAKEVLERYELKMLSYLQSRILEDKIFNDRIREYIEKDVFKGRAILEVEDFIYDKKSKIKEDVLKALLIKFKFFISKDTSSLVNFGFGSTSFNFSSNYSSSSVSFGFGNTSFKFGFQND